MRSILPISRLAAAFTLIGTLPLLTACGPERIEAPDDLEGLARFFWAHQLDATDDEMNEAINNTHAVLTELLADDEPRVGSLPSLVDEELAPVGLDGVNDPSAAPGLFLANRFDCDLDVLAEVLSAPTQAAFRPNVYDSYERDYRTDRDTWLSDGEGVIEWDVVYAATPTSTQYTAKTMSSVRRMPAVDGAVGPALVQRTVLKEPATFEGDPDSYVFDQDYQTELFYSTGDGEVFHLYGLWRYMQLGIVSVNDDVFVDFQLDGLITWDDQTEATCATWPDFPEG